MLSAQHGGPPPPPKPTCPRCHFFKGGVQNWQLDILSARARLRLPCGYVLPEQVVFRKKGSGMTWMSGIAARIFGMERVTRSTNTVFKHPRTRTLRVAFCPADEPNTLQDIARVSDYGPTMTRPRLLLLICYCVFAMMKNSAHSVTGMFF